MNDPVPWGSGKEGRGGRSNNQPTVPSAPAPLSFSNTAGPTFFSGLPKHPEGKPDTLLGTHNNRDERGAAFSRLVGCHSPRGAKKKTGNQTLKFSMFPPFFFVMLGPIKEPCEGPLEKASSGIQCRLNVPAIDEIPPFQAGKRGKARQRPPAEGRDPGPLFSFRVVVCCYPGAVCI